MSTHSFIDRRGPFPIGAEIPKTIQLPTVEIPTGAVATSPLVLTPFPDGTCLKMVKREFNPPVGHDQHILVNVMGDQLAITKNQAIAHLICDAVNMLFAAQVKHQEETAALVNTIAPTQDLESTQH